MLPFYFCFGVRASFCQKIAGKTVDMGNLTLTFFPLKMHTLFYFHVKFEVFSRILPGLWVGTGHFALRYEETRTDSQCNNRVDILQGTTANV